MVLANPRSQEVTSSSNESPGTDPFTGSLNVSRISTFVFHVRIVPLTLGEGSHTGPIFSYIPGSMGTPYEDGRREIHQRMDRRNTNGNMGINFEIFNSERYNQFNMCYTYCGFMTKVVGVRGNRECIDPHCSPIGLLHGYLGPEQYSSVW